MSYFKIKSHSALFSAFFIFIIALSNYQLAKIIQKLVLYFSPNFSYIWSLSLPWLLIGIVPIIAFRLPVFSLDVSLIRKNSTQILLSISFVVAGLALFVNLGVTSFFHSVKYPFIFFLITPIVEEIIFRGWIYDWSTKILRVNPVLLTAILFGLHHWQYFGYRVTLFAVFQIGYTFILGILFGKLREKSGSIYFPILLHILINYVSYNF